MPTEADTCRTYVVPRLYAAGWKDDQIGEQRTFTDGRILVAGRVARRGKPRRADYLLFYKPSYPLAVVEAKAEYLSPGQGMQQAKDYAQTLGLLFAYATNGRGIVEFDRATGIEREVDAFPSPRELWTRYRAANGLGEELEDKLLVPNHRSDKVPRYYQQIAINRAVEAILTGRKRVLLTLATGTGKTVIAFQIAWRLWQGEWNVQGRAARRPRILFLADRSFLVDDPKDKTFAPFGDARYKITGGHAIKSREMYFATYQAITGDSERPPLFHTRQERADRLRREQRAFFARYAPEARSIPDAMLDQYAEYGPTELVLPDMLKLPRFIGKGSPSEISRLFGGPDRLRDAVERLQALLYAA